MAPDKPWWAGMLWDALVMAAGCALLLFAKDEGTKHLGTALVSGFVIGGYALRMPSACKCQEPPPPPPEDPNSKPGNTDMVKPPSGKYQIAEPSVALAIICVVMNLAKQIFGGRSV